MILETCFKRLVYLHGEQKKIQHLEKYASSLSSMELDETTANVGTQNMSYSQQVVRLA